MKHVFPYRDDGLAVCSVCGAAEVELPTECPGVRLHGLYLEFLAEGIIDYSDGMWRPLKAGEPFDGTKRKAVCVSCGWVGRPIESLSLKCHGIMCPKCEKTKIGYLEVLT